MRGQERQKRLARIAEQVQTEQEAFLMGPMNEVHCMTRTGEQITFNMSRWLQHGSFGRLMVEGFHGHYSMASPGTMRTAYQVLTRLMGGLSGVSTITLTEITLNHITSALGAISTPAAQNISCMYVQLAIRFMADRAPDARRPYLLDDGVKGHLRVLVSHIAGHQRTLISYQDLYKGKRRDASKESSMDTTGRDLSLIDETTILAAAADEIERSWQLHIYAKELVKTGNVHDLETFPNMATLADCMATIDAAYSGRAWPTNPGAHINDVERRVWTRLSNLAAADPQVRLLRDALHFTSARALMPYIVALVWWSAWNVSPLQALKVSSITGLPLDPYEEPRANQRVLMRSVKHRKGGKTETSNEVSFDSLQSIRIERNRVLPAPAVILQRIRCLTDRLRQNLHGDPLDDRLLIVGSKGRTQGFGASGTSSSTALMQWRESSSLGFGAAAARNPPLPPFTLRDIRKTVLDKFSQRSLALGRDIGQHSAGTQRTFYLSDAAHARSRERVSVPLTALENLAESNGLTQSGRPDLLGAVPGFHCENPWESPIPSQKNGKRCAAMQCPICENAIVYLDDGRSYLQLFRRREALLLELRDASAARRIVVSKHLAGIERALDRFTPEAIEYARQHPRIIGKVHNLGGIE